MYTTSIFRSQIYAPLLPDRHSSSYGSHFLIRQVYNPSGRPLGITGPASQLHNLIANNRIRFRSSANHSEQLDFLSVLQFECLSLWEAPVIQPIVPNHHKYQAGTAY
jgi:hypothetical protein